MTGIFGELGDGGIFGPSWRETAATRAMLHSFYCKARGCRHVFKGTDVRWFRDPSPEEAKRAASSDPIEVADHREATRAGVPHPIQVDEAFLCDEGFRLFKQARDAGFPS